MLKPMVKIRREAKKGFNLESQILSSAKSRAKKSGLPFNLTVEDIKIPTHCPILGMELKRNKIGESRDSSPSIDRIIPSLGYVKGNVWIISMRANLVKGSASLDELILVTTHLRYKTKSEDQIHWNDNRVKNASLNLRVSKYFKQEVDAYCKSVGISVAKYITNLVSNDIFILPSKRFY